MLTNPIGMLNASVDTVSYNENTRVPLGKLSRNNCCRLVSSAVCHCSDFNSILLEPKMGVVSQAKNDPMADALEPW